MKTHLFRIVLTAALSVLFVWTTIPVRAEVGDAAWAKEGIEYANKLPPLKIPGSPVLRVGADEQYKDVASAIAALPPEGGTVHIAKGKYEIGESLRMPSHVALIGEGKDTRIQMKSGVLAHVITNADHKKGNTDILIRDLAIVGNLDSQGTPPVGHPTQGNDNCRGIYFKHVAGAQVLNCFITETGTNSFRADNSQDIALVNSEELFCFHCLNFTTCKNVTVAYYRATRKWSGESPYFNNTHHSQVFKNYVEGMGMDGMTFDFNSSFNDVRDNVVVGCSMSGIFLSNNANHNTIRDNLIKNNGRYKKNPQDRKEGIYMGNASQNTLAGNRCIDDQAEPTQRHGIYISNAACKDNIVSDNAFAGNTAGEIKDLGTNTRTTQAPQEAQAFSSVASPAPVRDPFLQPFSADSPWNTPISSGAQYQPIKEIEKFNATINYHNKWSCGFYKATEKDRKSRLYICPFTLWRKLDSGEVKTVGNPPEVEDALRKSATKEVEIPASVPANYYSTTVQSPPGPRTFPAGIRDIRESWTNVIYIPEGAYSSPDSDANFAVMQPNGLILECYGAVICANGDVCCTMASFSDPRGSGTGANNGRTASMLNNYAGLIRKGEISSGRIPHALSCLMSRLLLAPKAVWPAYAFDMNDNYVGAVPMGSLLAIPLDVDLDKLGLSEKGKVIAKAAQDYGIYVVDRGGDGGITFKAALDADDALYADRWKDAEIIVKHIQRVTNNGPNSVNSLR